MISTFTKALFVILSSSKVLAADDFCQRTCKATNGCKWSVCQASLNGGRRECMNLAKIGARNSISDFSVKPVSGLFTFGDFDVQPQYCDEQVQGHKPAHVDYPVSLTYGKQKVALNINCPSNYRSPSDVAVCSAYLEQRNSNGKIGAVTVALPERDYLQLASKFRRPALARPAQPLRPVIPRQPAIPFILPSISDLYPQSPFFPFNDPFIIDDTFDSFPFLPNPFRSMRLLNKQRLMTVTRAGPKGIVVHKTVRGFGPRGIVRETTKAVRFPLAGPRAVDVDQDYHVDSSGNIVKNIVETKRNGWGKKITKTQKVKGRLDQLTVRYDSFGNKHTKQYGLDQNNNLVKIKTVKDIFDTKTTIKTLGPKKKVRFNI